MAFPPTVPPATRTDSTPQLTNHPGAHNQISSALTDIINQVTALTNRPQSWTKALSINPGSSPGPGTIDFPLNFGPSPITGIGLVTVTSYIGFSQSPTGQAFVNVFTNAYTAPVGGGWDVGAPAITISGATWSSGGSVSLHLPVTVGVTPSAVIRLGFSTSNCWLQAYATIHAVEGGPWPS
jgi:hypothetical protein